MRPNDWLMVVSERSGLEHSWSESGTSGAKSNRATRIHRFSTECRTPPSVRNLMREDSTSCPLIRKRLTPYVWHQVQNTSGQPHSHCTTHARGCLATVESWSHHFGYDRRASTLNAWVGRSAAVVRRAAVIHWTRAVEIEMVEGTDE